MRVITSPVRPIAYATVESSTNEMSDSWPGMKRGAVAVGLGSAS